MKRSISLILAITALALSALSCGGGTTGAYLTTSASPSTFRSVGETLTFTYKVDAIDYFDSTKPYGVTDTAADATPACSRSGDGKQVVCQAAHVITAADVALGYVTSNAKFSGYVRPAMGGFLPVASGTSEYQQAEATTVVHMENFVPSPLSTITPQASATPDPSANAEVTLEQGNTTDLVSCTGTEFAFTVKDPEGVQQVYIEFAVADFDADFSTIAATLDLTNSGGDTWSGVFNDTISTQGKVTYWRVVVVDTNGAKTVVYEEGRFSFYARNSGCK
jgi:hypothetical protein